MVTFSIPNGATAVSWVERGPLAPPIEISRDPTCLPLCICRRNGTQVSLCCFSCRSRSVLIWTQGPALRQTTLCHMRSDFNLGSYWWLAIYDSPTQLTGPLVLCMPEVGRAGSQFPTSSLAVLQGLWLPDPLFSVLSGASWCCFTWALLSGAVRSVPALPLAGSLASGELFETPQLQLSL